MISWRIALRYLTAKKSHSAVGIISAVAVAGVAVATAAIVIVLSVFNGFADLAASRLSAIDADFKILPSSGKAFANADSLAKGITALPQIEIAFPIVQERGLLMIGNKQMPVIFKGVPDDYALVSNVDSTVIDGAFELESYGYKGLIPSVGVAIEANCRPGMIATLYAPRRKGRINIANPSGAFTQQEFLVTGVFQVNQPEYDKEHVFVPIEQARALLDYSTEANSIEASISGNYTKAEALDALKAQLAPAARILTKEHQEESSFRMIQIEKWVTFMMLAFILVIASFNIISTLSLMVMEKRYNLATFRALGAPKGMVKRIFIWLGCAITTIGALIGIALGSGLSFAQQIGGFITLAGDPSQLSITAYPVHVKWQDLLIVFLLAEGIAILSALATLLFTQDKNFKIKQ